MTRLSLAQQTSNDDLSAPPDDHVDPSVHISDTTVYGEEGQHARAPSGYREVLANANISAGESTPVLSEAIRALLIMTGTTAKWCGNYWLVKRRADDGAGAPAGTNAKKWRGSTGVRADATFEDWRHELDRFVGGLGK